MTAHSDLENRLRTGLRAASKALPPAEPVRPLDPTAGRDSVHRPGTRLRRGTVAALAAAAAVTVVGASMAGLALAGRDGRTPDVESTPAQDPEAGPPATGAATAVGDQHAGPGDDPVAGTAVVTGDELVTYGPDGQPGTTLSLAPLTGVQSAVPDRHGGWIVCGSTTDDVSFRDAEDGGTSWSGEPPTSVPADGGSGSTGDGAGEPEAQIAELSGSLDATSDAVDSDPVPTTYWFRPDTDPQPLPIGPVCAADSLAVTLVDGREVLLYFSGATYSVHQLDLATGADEPLAIDLGIPSSGQVTAGGGRLAMVDEAGLHVWDIATGEPVSAGPIDLPVSTDLNVHPSTSSLSLSPDGTRLAAIVGDMSAPSELLVFDLATGEELLRTSVPVGLEGDEISFDGTTVAVSNYSEGYGPVRIYDVASSDERTIDTHGILP